MSILEEIVKFLAHKHIQIRCTLGTATSSRTLPSFKEEPSSLYSRIFAQSAIRCMLAKRSSLRKWRLRQVEQLKSIARRAKPIDECLKCIPAIPCAPPALERVRTVNVAMLCLFCDTLQHPDVDLPRNYLHGFPVVGDIPDSGVLRPSPPATTDEEFWTGYHELMQTNDAWAAHLAQTVLLKSFYRTRDS